MNFKKNISFTMISSQEGTCGYREDDWQIINRIENEQDLYESLKEGYLADAYNRNDYPICSFPINISYIKDILDSTYGIEYIDWENEEQMDYRDIDSDIELEKEIKIKYKETFEKFEKWKSKIKTLLPILREAKRKKDKEISEKKQLKELAEKYGYVLAKKVEKKTYLLASIYDEEYMIISEEEKKLLEENTKNVYVEIEDDNYFSSCGRPPTWYLKPKEIEIRTISESIKEFMDDEDMFTTNGNIKELIKKCQS